ncbi:MAG: diguanylate cyclase [Anaeromyxobacter sp.]|nr:diguanylate cyclase [Anaeromyxobacter sp.]
MAHAVLLVDDERFARTVYSDYLRAAGYEVEVAADAEAALGILGRRRFDVLLTDVILPGSSGLDLLSSAKQLDPNLEVVVITALDKVDPAVRAMKSGASDYLVKPVTPEALQHAVQRSLSTRALLAENMSLRAHLKLFETCQRLAATLDRDRLVPMALAAVVSETAGTASLLAEISSDGSWVLSGAHWLEYQAAATALTAVRDALPALADRGVATVTLPDVSWPGDATHALCLPVLDEAGLIGAAISLVTAPPSSDRLASATFLCRHLGLALRNLGRLKQVEHLAYLDDLTRLYNTRYLDVVLDRELASGRPFTLLFMDVDHFKAVNDQHGHLSGSRLLVEVARMLRSCVRDEDVLVRYGGDEYVVLLVGIDSGGGLKVAERIRRAIEDHRFLSREATPVRITASIGLASYPEHAAGKSEIIDLADRAMYRGKRTTRNVVYMASRDLPPSRER